jgi:Na+-driven multidrug efflux pump
MLDTVTPVKISIFANIFNAILDPILMFSLAMGVPGAAIATLAAEMISAVTYISLMRRKQMIRFRKIFSIPSWQKLQPLLKGGAALQLRNFALNLTFLAVTRVTQSIDDTGVAAAAHALAIQTFQVGGIVLLALSTVAQTVVPSELVEIYDEDSQRTTGGVYATRAVVNRLMSWALLLGTFLGIFQLAILPTLHMATPMLEVRETARLPSYLASFYQAFNGMVFVGEGVMIGCGNYLQLSLSTLVATAGCLVALKTLPQRYGLAGVWIGFGVFNTLRLLGVILHQTRTGPLASKNLRKASSSTGLSIKS